MSALPKETQPLLPDSHLRSSSIQSDEVESIAAEYGLSEDEDYPSQWSATYRWGIVLLLACTAFTTTLACLSVVPVASGIIQELDGRKNKAASVLLVTTWELGEAMGPFLSAPLSELYGRRPVMNVGIISLLVCTAAASTASSSPMIIVTRFLSGVSVSTNVLNPAIAGDMLPADQLGAAMSLMILAPLLGGAVGPVLGGLLATRFGWRVMLRICAAGLTICEVLFFTTYQETFETVIVRRKLEKAAGNQATIDLHPGGGARRLLLESLRRPFRILWSSSMLQVLSLFASMAFAYLYITATTLPGIMRHCFHQTEAESAFAFLPVSLGEITAVIICNLFLDRIYVALRRRYGNKDEPENRLPLAICGGCLLPPAIVCFGWASYNTLHAMRLALVVLGGSMVLSCLPALSFVVGAFGQYSASACTAMIVSRALMGALLPLAIGPVVEAVGYGMTFTFWGAASLCLMPIPVLCMRYGHRWRQRSKYTRDT